MLLPALVLKPACHQKWRMPSSGSVAVTSPLAGPSSYTQLAPCCKQRQNGPPLAQHRPGCSSGSCWLSRCPPPQLAPSMSSVYKLAPAQRLLHSAWRLHPAVKSASGVPASPWEETFGSGRPDRVLLVLLHGTCTLTVADARHEMPAKQQTGNRAPLIR